MQKETLTVFFFITCISSAVHKDQNYLAEYKKQNPEQFKRFLSVRILFTLNYLIVTCNFETFVANLFSKYKQTKRDCRIQLAADPLATATNKTVRKQKCLHRRRCHRIFSCTKLTVRSIRD